MLFKKKEKETSRKIKANDLDYNGQYQYKGNEIKTARYNILTFLPLNLFQQFQRVANAYFLMLMILQLIPMISSLSPITTIIPLVTVLLATAIKDAYDDYNRHKSDKEVNNRFCTILRDRKMIKEKWMNIRVGDIIKIKDKDMITADLILLSSSNEHDLVYIETAELDGETNLKVRQAFPETGMLGEDENAFSNFDGRIECEAPNNQLHKFTGTLYWNDQEYGIDNDKILLRGCTLRNTDWCFAMVIFAGPDTKLMKNTGKTQFKRTSLDRLMNTLVWMIFGLLISLATVTAIANTIWENFVGYYFQVYQPWESYIQNIYKSGFLSFWSYIIILNTLVPISLYVSVEMIRQGQSMFIDWDRQLYYDKKNLPAVARTTSLNEELGQIEYVFSDKTGTLTQNIMEFLKCSINGESYGNVYDEHGYLMIPNKTTPQADFSYNPNVDPNFKFYDLKLVENMKNGDVHCHEFFRLIAICHTVMPAEEDGKITYQAQSPDEGALVSAARNFGFFFKSRTQNTITVEEMGDEVTYDVLAILDFDNVRKRMSVIVKTPDGNIILYCKGADSVIYERMSPENSEEYLDTTTEQLSDFANIGLRTLCCSKKELTVEEYDVWKSNHESAKTTLVDRDEALAAVYEEIEKDMILLGATAIEDKLQDGVPETIENLKEANMKIWVLTGDKQETAVNIGYSCKMLSEDMKEVFIISAHAKEEVRKEISEAKKAIQASNPTLANMEVSYSSTNDSLVEQESNLYGIVINGHSLAHALVPEMEEEFLNLACCCSAVICCRVTPLQKAQVVNLVKHYKTAVTLAIGDGANDVSMIKAAHIGIGISGEEGTQAVLSADYSFGQFRFLERLLLVHGRWSYMRMCKFLGYFFYKNFTFTFVHFWFAFFCGFSAMSIFDVTYITVYNVVYTSGPVIMLAVFDQDVDDVNCILYPKLYKPGQRNALFNKKIFAKSAVLGIVQSLILFFIPYGALIQGNSSAANLQSLGLIIATCLTIIVNLQVGLETAYWTPINHFFIWGSIAIFFMLTFGLYSDGLYVTMPSFQIGVARETLSQGYVWLIMLFVIVLCISPVIIYRYIKETHFPEYIDQIMRKQIKHKKQQKKSKGRSIADFTKIKNKLIRRNSRPRSGYAFSHEHGFGDLITTGRMSMRRKTANNKEDNNTVQEVASVSGQISKNQLPNSIPTPSHKETDLSPVHEYEQIDLHKNNKPKDLSNQEPRETYRPIPV